MPSRPRPSRRRRSLLLVLLAVAVAAAAGFWLTTRADDDTTAAGDVDPVAAPTTEAPDESGEPVTTLEPERTGGVPVPTAPSSEVATDGATDERPESNPEPAPNSADVTLTFTGWDDATSSVEAGGYVVGASGEGNCTLTLTTGGPTRSASGPAFSDATSMSCGTLRIAGDQLASGTWQAVLSFESDHASGESAPVEVEVP